MASPCWLHRIPCLLAQFPIPSLAVERLTVEFATTDRVVSTVRGLSFEIARGGTVAVKGRDIATLADGALPCGAPRHQMIFQDPFASLNPRLTVGYSVAEPQHSFPTGAL